MPSPSVLVTLLQTAGRIERVVNEMTRRVGFRQDMSRKVVAVTHRVSLANQRLRPALKAAQCVTSTKNFRFIRTPAGSYQAGHDVSEPAQFFVHSLFVFRSSIWKAVNPKGDYSRSSQQKQQTALTARACAGGVRF